MNKIRIEIDNQCIADIIKLISFASQEIDNFVVEDNCIIIEVVEGADINKARSKVNRLIEKFIKEAAPLEEVTIFNHQSEKKYLCKELIYNSNMVKDFGGGLISLKSEALDLFKYFDSIFRDFALELNAIEKSYPTLLPVDAYRKTGYLKTSPQYSIFCCTPKEDIEYLEQINKHSSEGKLLECFNQPGYALSPAACFHSYMELERSTIESPCVFTFHQNVFRHEGRFNWNDFGRLKDYHVREIVFFGDMEYVTDGREKIAAKTKNLIQKMDLNGRLCIAFDPFIVPSMQKFKKIQIQEQSKYELQLAYFDNQYLAVSSFNLHGTAFTEPFNISVNGCLKPVTGCVGFGIERWVLAFLSQYGIDPNQWPKIL
jgi:seryl-tRNA synthetase